MIINRTQQSITSSNKGSRLALLSERLIVTGTASTFGSGTSRVYIELVGGGGGGGGAVGNNGQSAAAGGGGAGAFSSIVLNVTPDGSFTYTIGTAGTGGAITGGNGTSGGTTSITIGATTVTAPGGSGGTGSASGTVVASVLGGAGGVAGTGGDVNVPGMPGDHGIRFSATIKSPGDGGSGPYGAGGRTVTFGNGQAGQPGLGNGSGGSGANTGNNTDRLGGDGTVGAIYIAEYGYI